MKNGRGKSCQNVFIKPYQLYAKNQIPPPPLMGKRGYLMKQLRGRSSPRAVQPGAAAALWLADSCAMLSHSRMSFLRAHSSTSQAWGGEERAGVAHALRRDKSVRGDLDLSPCGIAPASFFRGRATWRRRRPWRLGAEPRWPGCRTDRRLVRVHSLARGPSGWHCRMRRLRSNPGPAFRLPIESPSLLSCSPNGHR